MNPTLIPVICALLVALSLMRPAWRSPALYRVRAALKEER
jgi:hypothetical protein